jgi:superfamily I DNA and/or RNA helicase
MVLEDRQRLKNDLRVLVNEVKGLANVVGLTVNALAVPRNRDNLGDFDLALVDEGGMMNVAEFLAIAANLTECAKYIILSDCNQLEP